MVVAAGHNTHELYAPFAGPFVVEDTVQSSEDGSGLHSPTFMDSDHSDFRPPQPDIDMDIHSVAGVLASHFSPTYSNSYSSPTSGQYPYELDSRYAPRAATRTHYSPSAYRPPSPSSYFGGGAFDTHSHPYHRVLALPPLLSSPHDSRASAYEDASPISPLDGPSSGSRPSTSSASQLSSHAHPQQQPQSLTSLSSTGTPGPSSTSPITTGEGVGGSSVGEGAGPGGSSASAASAAAAAAAARREPSLVVIACRQCRARKIRCDSSRPACHNCVRRQNDCAYDAVPKRRGPDKRPGTRTRSCKKRPPNDPNSATSGAGTSSTASTPSPSTAAGAQTPAKKKRKGSSGAGVGVRVEEGGGGGGGGVVPMSGVEPEGVGGGGGAGGGGGNNLSMGVKPNMGLRLDMNFSTRPGSGGGGGMGGAPTPSGGYSEDLGSAHHLHPYSHPHHQLSPHPHPHSHSHHNSFHYTHSATSSPTTTLSIQSHSHTPMPRSAISPVLTLPKPQSPHRRGPFSMYDDLSPGSTAATLSDSADGRSFPLELNLPHHSHAARDERVYLSPAHAHLSPHAQHPGVGHAAHVSPVTLASYGALGMNVGTGLSGVNALSAAAATVEYSTKLWWDNLLSQYSSNREQSEVQVFEDLASLFSASIHWLSFLNTNLFLRKLYDASERENMSPALVLAALALATLLKSSEVERGASGRQRAIWLRDGAQSYLDAAWSASMVDPQLAQAAMLIAVFEASAHPQHSSQRACDALSFLDRIIQALSLTRLDAGDPNASLFVPCGVPSVPRAYPSTGVGAATTAPGTRGARTSPVSEGISSGAVAAAASGSAMNAALRASAGLASVVGGEDRLYCAPPIHSPALDIGRMSPSWASSLRWDAHWSKEEIEAEETRRLCWAALSLAAAHTAHCAAFHREPLDLFICRPENYALLFPNERRESDGTGKQSVWALYCRSMLLWNSCMRLRRSASDNEKAEFAMQAWLECNDIQDLFEEQHSPLVDSHLVYMSREHIFNTRIAVQHEFRRLQDLGVGSNVGFNRRQAEEWLHYQTQTAKRFEIIVHDAGNPQAQVLIRRPFYVWWFMNQFAISMSLWEHDKTLVQALDLCKAFLVPLDILSTLWPCDAQRERYLQLREELAENCEKARLPPPPPPDFKLPIALR